MDAALRMAAMVRRCARQSRTTGTSHGFIVSFPTAYQEKDPITGLTLLLLRYTDCASTTTSSFGMLTTDTESPVVTQTTVSADLLQSLEILTQFVFQHVGRNLGEFAVFDVFLSVQEPIGDLVLTGVGHDGDQFLDLLFGEFSGTFGDVNVGLLQDNIGVSSTNTFDGGDGEHNLDPTIDIGIQDTQNMLKFLGKNQRLLGDMVDEETPLAK